MRYVLTKEKYKEIREELAELAEKAIKSEIDSIEIWGSREQIKIAKDIVRKSKEEQRDFIGEAGLTVMGLYSVLVAYKTIADLFHIFFPQYNASSDLEVAKNQLAGLRDLQNSLISSRYRSHVDYLVLGAAAASFKPSRDEKVLKGATLAGMLLGTAAELTTFHTHYIPGEIPKCICPPYSDFFYKVITYFGFMIPAMILLGYGVVGSFLVEHEKKRAEMELIGEIGRKITYRCFESGTPMD